MSSGKVEALTHEQKREIIRSMCPIAIYEMMTEDQQRDLDMHIMPADASSIDLDAGIRCTAE